MIDVDLLVETEEWLATHVKPDTANTAFNITNGDVTRWKHVRHCAAHRRVLAMHRYLPFSLPKQDSSLFFEPVRAC